MFLEKLIINYLLNNLVVLQWAVCSWQLAVGSKQLVWVVVKQSNLLKVRIDPGCSIKSSPPRCRGYRSRGVW